MTESFDRRQHRFPVSRYFEDLVVGERFYVPSRTVTEAHFAAFQMLSGDNHPIHYDVEYCRGRGHPGPLAHGFQILCFTAAGASSFALAVGDALIAFVEQSSKFLKPVFPGDTLYPMLEIAALMPQRSTGIVTLERAQPAGRIRSFGRTEDPAAQARRRNQPVSMTSASNSGARRHWSRLTSRWVTARTVRAPKAETSTPTACARSTIAAASGPFFSM